MAFKRQIIVVFLIADEWGDYFLLLIVEVTAYFLEEMRQVCLSLFKMLHIRWSKCEINGKLQCEVLNNSSSDSQDNKSHCSVRVIHFTVSLHLMSTCCWSCRPAVQLCVVWFVLTPWTNSPMHWSRHSVCTRLLWRLKVQVSWGGRDAMMRSDGENELFLPAEKNISKHFGAYLRAIVFTTSCRWTH